MVHNGAEIIVALHGLVNDATIMVMVMRLTFEDVLL